MFYETYSKVSEFCAGCNAHNESIEGDAIDFPLKAPISLLGRSLSDDQKSLFCDSNEVILYADYLNEDDLFKALIQKRVSCILVPTDKKELIWEKIIEQEILVNIFIAGYEDVIRLVKKQGFYYTEGIVAVFYDGNEGDILKTFRRITRYLRNKNGIRIIHVVKENVYFGNLGKTITEFIEGPTTTIEALLS